MAEQRREGRLQKSLLVVNAGSSSLKFHVYDIAAGEPVFCLGGQVSGIGSRHASLRIGDGQDRDVLARALERREAESLESAQQVIAEWLTGQLARPPLAVGHRIVHGGSDFVRSTVIDDEVLGRLEALAPLAPLHQHNNLAPIHVIRQRWPRLLQVACFDTAFHRSFDAVAERFALPERFYEQGVRRYGFHGLSYQYLAERLRQVAPELAAGRVIVAHLGSGASACAMVGGRSVDSTMSFTALDGLPMATRPGHLDAGVVLWMMAQGMGHREIQQVLYHESGLLGLSGLSGDVRDLLASELPAARLALDYYAWRVAEGIAGLCTASRGLDGLVFTAGVGENSAPLRAAICQRLEWLGLRLDPERNAAHAAVISSADSAIPVRVEATNEEWVIARQTLALLHSD